MSNHLKNETSPYLLQHAENPVEWYPWCDEAFARAKREDKPIFLSVGYSTCHWCHVMAHESFEDGAIAALLNRSFVSIKVDREERPDIDSVYMSVCQAYTGSGGWPMTIFMTWEKKPFFAGTYFPPHAQYGRPGFCELLRAVEEKWSTDRKTLLGPADALTAAEIPVGADGTGGDGGALFERALQQFFLSFDSENGGFGAAPKFPMPHNLLFLMLYAKEYGRRDVLRMVERTLVQMRKGGIFDQIGYGFSRYSTDPYFLAPHFEKMLYDNAGLILAYAGAYALTQTPLFLDTAEKAAAFVLREMTHAQGGFYSAQDADSEGVEGRYYTFTLDEVMGVLGKEAGTRFARAYDITASGNFEGVSIPNLLKSNEKSVDFCEELQKLYRYRKNRFRLHLDDKILTAWNGMMIAALSMLYRISRRERYLLAAKSAQLFLEEHLMSPFAPEPHICRGAAGKHDSGSSLDGQRLCASWRDGRRSEKGFLDDYAYTVAGLLGLYDATLERAYLERAKRLCAQAVRMFYDEAGGGFFLSPPEESELFRNPKEFYDGAVPSGNSVMAYNLVRLSALTGDEETGRMAERLLRDLSARAQDYPMGHGMFLIAKLLWDNPLEHIVIALKEPSDLEEVRDRLPLLANVVTTAGDEAYPLVNDRTTFYVCRGHTCLAPSNVFGR